jgi:electron transport complex protein RnfG
MREMIKLVLAILIFSALSGGLLAALNNGLKDRIEYQELKFVKGPTIKAIMEGCENDPLGDRFTLKDGEIEFNFFIGEFDGKRNTIAFETFGKGYGGDVGVIVAINTENDSILGIGVTTHSETPGLGARAKTDPDFAEQFKGLGLDTVFKVKTDGGDIDALTGATMTSRGVSSAVAEATEIYKRLKDEIVKKLTS